MVNVEPGTIAVFADLACPWAHLAMHRLHATRRRLGLDDRVRLDLRAYPLEIFNARPTPKRILDAEIPIVGALDPAAGWQMWQGDASEYPVSTLLALEAVQAAKEQGLAASERLDLALRKAFFAESRCISLRNVVLEVANGCQLLDFDELIAVLDSGRCRRLVFDEALVAEFEAQGSPHLFLPDGSDVMNPGIDMHWEGEEGQGFPVIDADDPKAYEDLLRRAAGDAA